MSRSVEYTMGLLVRRDFRRFLNTFDVSYSEDKGFLDSQFIVTGSENDIEEISSAVDRANAERNT